MECLFSSIAWTRDQAEMTTALLLAGKADGIEASPGLFDRPLAALSSTHIREVRNFWADHGLPVRAMQALLFGGPKLRLFGTDEERHELANYLRLVFQVAGQLGAGPLVFGSPRNRLRGDLDPKSAFDCATAFFADIAPYAAAEGCTLCIEANAPAYGCDWITTHAEAIALVKAVDSPGFGLQLDTGVMQMNSETPEELLKLLQENAIIPEHVHASEPFLAPLNAKTPLHRCLNSSLKSLGYAGYVSIEMKSPQKDYFADKIVTSLSDVVAVYKEKALC